MSDRLDPDCHKQFKEVTPPGPWDSNTPVSRFEPLVNLIEQNTQSDMFRRVGKYQGNGDYYEIARDLEDQDKQSGQVTFDNGVKAQVEQLDGWPTRLVLEDSAAGKKETVTLDEMRHTITSTKTEFCGVSRTRLFGLNGEYARTYDFEGGAVEKTGALPVLKIEK